MKTDRSGSRQRPPSECFKIMLHRLVSRRGHKLLYADVSRAYFYAPAVRPVYVQLPDENRGRHASSITRPRTWR